MFSRTVKIQLRNFSANFLNLHQLNMIVLNLIVFFVLTLTCGVAKSDSSGSSAMLPPYTCTTTVCRPGLSPPHEENERRSIHSGPPGKKGLQGIRGDRGEKGDPCQCNATKENEFNSLKIKIEELELENKHLAGYNPIGSATNPARSCFNLKQEEKASGIYTIQYNEHSAAIKVFCDMQHAGGGWTLVASVHENNIEGKCTTGDLWSSDQGNASEAYKGTGNWENFNSFGTPHAATSADYKSDAYFSLPATDVMVWHVPNNVNIYDAHNHATLMYYTNTSFLNAYGSTLQSLFKIQYHMQKIEKEYKASTSVEQMISLLNISAVDIRNLVPQFYLYKYDSDVPNKISDGGDDMYDSGNVIHYQINGNEEIPVTYNKEYRNESYDVHLLSATSHPFNVLAWIGDGEQNVNSFALKVAGGSGADGAGSFSTSSGIVKSGTFRITYHAFNVYAAGTDPSISKVFYCITSHIWRSEASSFTRSPWSTTTDPLSHGVLLSQKPRRAMVGYTLLSRSAGVEVTNGQIQSVLSKILAVFADTNVINCDHRSKSLVQPVTYIRGNDQNILNSIPTESRPDVRPGFLQFRAFNSDGLPNALCSGFQTTSCNSQRICVGGINTVPYDASSCGDFAGWGDTQGGSLQQTRPTSTGKALRDIDSTILMFTRKQE